MKMLTLLDQYGKPISKKINKVLASGYSSAAASLTKPVFKGWDWQGADPDSDIVQHLPIIRQRSRQLSMEAPIVAGLYKTLTTNVVGDGLRPEPVPDVDFLKMSPEAAKSWKSDVLRYWETFAESPNCDCARRDNFYELTRLVFRAQNESGDAFVTMPRFDRRNAPFSLKIQVIEADCVATPEGQERAEHEMLGNDVLGGVEISEWGHVVGYWFYTGPYKNASYRRNWHTNAARHDRWIFIPAYGAETGLPNVLHLTETLRPGQRRGIPLIAPIIELCLTLDRYLKAETIAAQIQSLFTMIIKSNNPDALAGEYDALEKSRNAYYDENEVALGNGVVQFIRPGDDVVPVNPSRPTTSFGPFVDNVIQLMGPTTGMPYEMLIQKFQSSYSASRAAINMASTQFKILRSGLVNDFCQPIYEAFMDEAVARGWIYAPGYFDNPIIHRAYTRAKWNGPGLPQVDMLKEVQAWEKQVSLGFATAGQATSELNGGDYMENLSIRAREIEAAVAAGLSPAAATGMTNTAASIQSTEQEDDQAASDGGTSNVQVL